MEGNNLATGLLVSLGNAQGLQVWVLDEGSVQSESAYNPFLYELLCQCYGI